MTQNIEVFLDTIDTFIEKDGELKEERFPELAAQINSTEDFGECLPEIVKRSLGFKDNADKCDAKSKQFADSKKMWKTRGEQLGALVTYIMQKLNTKSITANGSSAKITSRDVLEVDENSLLTLYTALVDQLQQQLPSFVKVSVSIDKRALSTHMQTDNSLMVNHPEWVHTKESNSLKLK